MADLVASQIRHFHPQTRVVGAVPPSHTADAYWLPSARGYYRSVGTVTLLLTEPR